MNEDKLKRKSSIRKLLYANRILKLSSNCRSYNERLLAFSNGVLSYYREVPVDFTEKNPILPTNKLKESIYISDTEISKITEEDKGQVNILDLTRCFKV